MVQRKRKWTRDHGDWDGPDGPQDMFVKGGHKLEEVLKEFKDEPGCSWSMLQKRCANRTPANKLGQGWVNRRRKYEEKLKRAQEVAEIQEIIKTRRRHRGFVQFALAKAAKAMGFPVGESGVDIQTALLMGIQFDKAPDIVTAFDKLIRLERLILGENDRADEIGGDFRVEVTLVRAEDRDDRQKRLDRAVLAAAKGKAEAEEQHPGGDDGEREVDADGEARGGDVLS